MKIRYLDESGKDATETYDRSDVAEDSTVDVRKFGDLGPLEAVQLANEILDTKLAAMKAQVTNGRP
jgi:hypothetical protein